jgi:hypothetical protein
MARVLAVAFALAIAGCTAYQAAQWATAMVMVLVTDLSIPLRLGITVEARCLDLVWATAGAEGVGVVMAATGTVMGAGMVVNTMAAAGMALVDAIVVDMVAVGTTRPRVAITLPPAEPEPAAGPAAGDATA